MARSLARNGAVQTSATVADHDGVFAIPIRPGARYKITRRCLERRFFLRPDAETTAVFGYWLVICLQRYGILLHAVIVMSNHYHLDVTDPHGLIIELERDFNAVLARVLNAKYGRFDKFWSADAPCDVALVNDDDVLDRIAYTLVNPVTAGLVRSGRLWTGLSSWGKPFGSTMTFAKPKAFFAEDNVLLPDQVDIVLVRPNIHPNSSDAELDARLLENVHRREHAIQYELRGQNRRFLGMQRVLAQHHDDTPVSQEKRFGLRRTTLLWSPAGDALV